MKIQDIPRRVHFVGIGGIGMSALAQYLHRSGYVVTGSDRTASERTDALIHAGIPVYIGHNAANVVGAEAVVHTSAVHVDNVEIAEAERRNIPVVLREQVLGAVFNSFAIRVAVCGTHGKTTVTAMLHEIFNECGVSHSAFIGGVYNGNNFYFGQDAVIAEACEYNRSFLNLNPTVCVILNAEWDHPDCYVDEQAVFGAFAQFAENTSDSGTVILPRNLQFLEFDRKREYYDDVKVSNLAFADGKPRFDLVTQDKKLSVKLNVTGRHNVNNALAALAVAKIMRLPTDKVLQALSRFNGVDRRWTEKNGVCKVVCDYAHHPTEIECSVSTARSITNGKVVCLFQPHTYSRTQAFFDRFALCFRDADKVIYLPVYSAREKSIDGVTSQALAVRARELGVNACYAEDFAKAKETALKSVSPNDLLLVLGAGDISGIVDLFCKG